MKIRQTLAVSFVVALALPAIFCRGNESLEGQAKDARLKTEIKSKLATQVDASTLLSVEVNVTNGVATLAGPVHSVDESRRIESVVRSVPGVSDVKVALQILAPQEIVTPPAATAPPADRKS